MTVVDDAPAEMFNLSRGGGRADCETRCEFPELTAPEHLFLTNLEDLGLTGIIDLLSMLRGVTGRRFDAEDFKMFVEQHRWQSPKEMNWLADELVELAAP